MARCIANQLCMYRRCLHCCKVPQTLFSESFSCKFAECVVDRFQSEGQILSLQKAVSWWSNPSVSKVAARPNLSEISCSSALCLA